MGPPVTVLGAGSFGTCLALLCARQGRVALWARDPDHAAAIDRDRRNPRYLPEAHLPDGVRATSDLAEALTDSELVVCAVPSHSLREVMCADEFQGDMSTAELHYLLGKYLAYLVCTGPQGELHYRFEGRVWCDTLLADGGDGFRLVRMEQLQN